MFLLMGSLAEAQTWITWSPVGNGNLTTPFAGGGTTFTGTTTLSDGTIVTVNAVVTTDTSQNSTGWTTGSFNTIANSPVPFNAEPRKSLNANRPGLNNNQVMGLYHNPNFRPSIIRYTVSTNNGKPVKITKMAFSDIDGYVRFRDRKDWDDSFIIQNAIFTDHQWIVGSIGNWANNYPVVISTEINNQIRLSNPNWFNRYSGNGDGYGFYETQNVIVNNNQTFIQKFTGDVSNGSNKRSNQFITMAMQVTPAPCLEDVSGNSFSWDFPTSTTGQVITQNITQPGTDGGFVFDIYELDNSFNMTINGQALATSEIEFQAIESSGQNIRFADGTIWEAGGIDDIWKLVGDAENPIVRVVIDEVGGIRMYGSKVNNGPLHELELFNGNSFNTINWNQNANNSITVKQTAIGPTKMRGYGYGKNIVPCYCTKPGMSGVAAQTNVGISTLDRNVENWLSDPAQNKLGAYIALESKESAMVITRNANPNMIQNPIEGMLIWDTTENCLKLFKGPNFGWKCISRGCNE